MNANDQVTTRTVFYIRIADEKHGIMRSAEEWNSIEEARMRLPLFKDGYAMQVSIIEETRTSRAVEIHVAGPFSSKDQGA